MINYITDNLATILISAILFIIVASLIRKVIKDKKNGCSSCGGGCSTTGCTDFSEEEMKAAVEKIKNK